MADITSVVPACELQGAGHEGAPDEAARRPAALDVAATTARADHQEQHPEEQYDDTGTLVSLMMSVACHCT